MKYIFTILLIICCLSTTTLFAQTLELEKRYQQKTAGNSYNAQSNSEKKLATVRELLNHPDYPKVPYDMVAQNFDFRFVIPVADSLQKTVFDKLRLWSVARYIQPGFGLKMQDTAGLKLLVYGYTDVITDQRRVVILSNTYNVGKRCNYSLILKVSAGKIEGQFVSVEYAFSNVSSNEQYYHVNTVIKKIGSLFPLTQSTSNEMSDNVDLIIETAQEFKRIEQEIANFIKNP